MYRSGGDNSNNTNSSGGGSVYCCFCCALLFEYNFYVENILKTMCVNKNEAK